MYPVIMSSTYNQRRKIALRCIASGIASALFYNCFIQRVVNVNRVSSSMQQYVRRTDTLSTQQKDLKPIIHTCFHPLREEDYSRNKPMLELWEKSWMEAGWKAVILTLNDARKHPDFYILDSLLESRNMEPRIRLNYFCYLAVSFQGGGWFSEPYVLPLRPNLNELDLLALPNNGQLTGYNNPVPYLLSGSKVEWDRVTNLLIQTYQENSAIPSVKFPPYYHYENAVLHAKDAFPSQHIPDLCNRLMKKRVVNFFDQLGADDADETSYSKVLSWMTTWKERCMAIPSVTTSFTNYFNIWGNKQASLDADYPVPSFIIIGAQKSATTLFDRLLQNHTMIAKHDTKEKHYFDNPLGERNFQIIKNKYMSSSVESYRNQLSAEGYKRLFPEADGKSITFDSTPDYILWTNVLPKVKEICPKTKFVVMLRDPVERLFSQYNMYVNYKWFEGSFEKFIEGDLWNMREAGLIPNSEYIPFTDNVDDGWNIFLHRVEFPNFMTVGRGLYSLQLRQWFQHFPRDSFLVLNIHDLKKQNGVQNMYDRVTDFIGIPRHDLGEMVNKKSFVADYNAVPMNPETKEMLYDLYSFYNEQLSMLLGKEWEGFGKMKTEI